MSIGIWQVILVLCIVMILFGAGKLPKVMGDFAKGIKAFKKGLHEDDENDLKVVSLESRSSKPKKSTAKKAS